MKQPADLQERQAAAKITIFLLLTRRSKRMVKTVNLTKRRQSRAFFGCYLKQQAGCQGNDGSQMV